MNIFIPSKQAAEKLSLSSRPPKLELRRIKIKKNNISFLFIGAALIALIVGLFFGVIGGLQYILPGFLKENLSFEKTRPIHVTLVITWIFTGAVGGIYFYLPKYENKKLYSTFLAQLHFFIFIVTGIIILLCYSFGKFGGREYLEFPPVLALPMLLTWILFTVNFFMTINKNIRQWPVYLWMWSTGVIFFLITFGEAYLWTMPYFQNNIVRDLTVQWKAMGSMVGSWNMLVYGTGFYVMEKISGDNKIANSKLTFFLYFLGLTNLMFNWGHHTYIVPAESWIKNVSYIISMTELLILGNIILSWRKSLSSARKFSHLLTYRFLFAADIWIFLNLILAIIISIPTVNYFTHGTLITVAHAMGATIGINTMILFASLFFIAEQISLSVKFKIVNAGFWITNISLMVFWFTLISSGILKALQNNNGINFQQMMLNLAPWFHVFALSGIGILTGILFISFPFMKSFNKSYLSTQNLLLNESRR